MMEQFTAHLKGKNKMSTVAEYMEKELAKENSKLADVMELIVRFGDIDGEHHKQWCLDQIARIILGDKYDAWRYEMLGEFDNATLEFEYAPWNQGIAP